MKTKNILIWVATALLIVALGIFGYVQMTSGDTPKEEEVQGVEQTEKQTCEWEHLTAMDKQEMYLTKEDYSHFETNYMFAGEVDTLSSCDVVFMANIFQICEGRRPTVFCYRHYSDGNYDMEKKVGAFWIEDFDLNDYEINLSIEQAFDALMRANCPKPLSKYCTLRAAVGPVKANPQYIFGNNNRGIVWVDATTGEVSTVCPTNPDADDLTLFEQEDWREFIYRLK